MLNLLPEILPVSLVFLILLCPVKGQKAVAALKLKFAV